MRIPDFDENLVSIQLLMVFPLSLKLECAPEVKPEVPFFSKTVLDLKQNLETESTPLRPKVIFVIKFRKTFILINI